MNKLTLAALALGAAATAAAQAAAPAPISPKVPISNAPLVVKMPRPVETVLPNGLTVIVLEDHRSPQVTATLQMGGAGDFFDPADRVGLAEFTAQMMSQGTTTRNATQVAGDVANLGATIGFAAAPGGLNTTAGFSGLSENFAAWWKLATEELLQPAFAPDELDKIKQQARQRLRQQRSQPAFLASERFNQAIFGNFPAAVTSTNEAAIAALTRDDLVRWHHERYAPQNAILGITGDLPAAQLLAAVQTSLGGWAKTSGSDAIAGGPQPQTTRRIYLVDRPGSVQTTLQMGGLGISRTSPDYAAMVVLNQVFGAGPQSRLFVDIREAKGLAYDVSSGISAGKFAGPWRVSSNVRTAVTDEAVKGLLDEITLIRDQPVPAAELEMAKQVEVARFGLALENPAALLGDFVTAQTYALPAGYWDGYPARILAVTAADVQRVARQYFNPDTLQIVAVGDAKTIASVLAKYGAVSVYGSDGKAAGGAGPR